jgi:hypothetical protein
MISCSPQDGEFSQDIPDVKYVISYKNERNRMCEIYCNSFKLNSNIAHVKGFWVHGSYYDYIESRYEGGYVYYKLELWVVPIEIRELR